MTIIYNDKSITIPVINNSLLNNIKVFISDLFNYDSNISYPFNVDNIKRFAYKNDTLPDHSSIFPFFFNFHEYLPFNINFLTDTNHCFTFDLDDFTQIGFDINSDFLINTLYISSQKGYIKSFKANTELMNAVEFFDFIIDDKVKHYSIKEKKKATLKWFNDLPVLIKNTYLNNPDCFKILCDKLYINYHTVEIINAETLKLKDKFVFDFKINLYSSNESLFDEKTENIILSFYDSLNINEDNYQSFIANKEQIKVLKYFDELSFDYKLRPNTLYCRELKDYLKYDGYNQLYFKLLRLFFMKIDFIPFFETFTEEQKQKLLEEHINFENHLKLDDMNLETLQIYEYCQYRDFHQIELDVFDYDDLINFHKIFLYDKLTKSLKPKENTSSNKKLKI